MNASNITDITQTHGSQAKVASVYMAKSPEAIKNRASLRLASLLRENTQALQVDNTRDLERAFAAGLAAPLVDRLKLTPKVLETCAQGCDQLAAMADVFGEIIGSNPAASAWGRCARPLACSA